MKILWTDGSASPNPGPGGYAVIEDGKMVRCGYESNSTNIRMEGWAMIAAIEYAGDEGCEIHSDSQFWINVLTKWAWKWQKNGWLKHPRKYDKEGNPLPIPKKDIIENLEIVKKLYGLYHQYPVKLIWVRGHVGTEMNELADEWAKKAREKGVENEKSHYKM